VTLFIVPVIYSIFVLDLKVIMGRSLKGEQQYNVSFRWKSLLRVVPARFDFAANSASLRESDRAGGPYSLLNPMCRA
jgi:hypothetical protein